jgi:hypothetical protein
LTTALRDRNNSPAFWILDVDGAIVIIDAIYRRDTPAHRDAAIAESTAFESP